MNSGSIDVEINQRLGILYSKHNDWLQAVSYNLCKNKDVSQDLVQELYLYLGEKQNPKLYFNDSFNLLYCYNFISSRFINFIKRENRSVYVSHWKDVKDDVYIIFNADGYIQWEHEYDGTVSRKRILQLAKISLH